MRTTRKTHNKQHTTSDGRRTTNCEHERQATADETTTNGERRTEPPGARRTPTATASAKGPTVTATTSNVRRKTHEHYERERRTTDPKPQPQATTDDNEPLGASIGGLRRRDQHRGVHGAHAVSRRHPPTRVRTHTTPPPVHRRPSIATTAHSPPRSQEGSPTRHTAKRQPRMHARQWNSEKRRTKQQVTRRTTRRAADSEGRTASGERESPATKTTRGGLGRRDQLIAASKVHF
ncbi:hypothetical protein BD410DRAFT_889837 [Rickenella mellea]|uniref:Uncharacterized protein n=1 Tax=Rickenella mellea TaxID=50990 RepID=A0A4Y7PLH4_9AGAM|nr:hypothetical protein BD410DRAFT_889837 [Rickenella mellea]